MTPQAAGHVDGACWVVFESLRSCGLGRQKYRVLWMIVQIVIGCFEGGHHGAVQVPERRGCRSLLLGSESCRQHGTDSCTQRGGHWGPFCFV